MPDAQRVSLKPAFWPNGISPAHWAALAVPGVLALFLLLSAAFDFSGALGVLNFKRAAQGALLLLIFLLALGNFKLRATAGQQAARMPRWMAIVLLLALVLGLVSALRHPHPAYGLAEISLLALTVCAALLVAAGRQLAGPRCDRLLLGLLALMGLAVVVQEFMGLLAGWALGREFSYQQMLIRFAHPRFYNQLQSWTLPLLAALPFVFSARPAWRVFAVLALGLQWCVLLMTGGRGAVLAIITSLVLVTLLTRGWRRAWFRLHLLGMLLGAVCYGAVLAGHAQFAPAGGEFLQQSVARPMLHSTGRTHLWRLAIEDARQHPWLGAGPARFNCQGSDRWPAHPHNFPLRLLAEWGIPAALLILAVCLVIAGRLLRLLLRYRAMPPENAAYAKDATALDTLLIAGIFAAALHAGVSGVLMMPASQLMAALACGWLLGRLPPRITPSPGSRRPGIGLALCAAAALGAAGLNAFNMHELREMDQRVAALKEAGPAQPRYWQYGRACHYRYAASEQARETN